MQRTEIIQAGQAATLSLGRTAIQAVRIDNLSRLWYRLDTLLIWIPPYTYGAMFPLLGQGDVSISPGAPSAIDQPAAINAGDIVYATIYDSPQQYYPGTILKPYVSTLVFSQSVCTAPAQGTIFGATGNPYQVLVGASFPVVSLAIKNYAVRDLAAPRDDIYIQGDDTTGFNGYILKPGEVIEMDNVNLNNIYAGAYGANNLQFVIAYLI